MTPALAGNAGNTDFSWAGDGEAELTITSTDIASGIAVRHGKVAVVARSFSGSGGSYFGVERLTGDGDPDTTFSGDGTTRFRFIPSGASGPIDSYVNDVAIQSDDKVVASGWAKRPDGRVEMAVGRLTADGKLDKTFSSDGGRAIGLPGSDARRLAIQPNGKILLAGPIGSKMGVIRLKADGSTDKTFGTDGIFKTSRMGGGRGEGLALQPDGKIILTGISNTSEDGFFQNGDVGILRLKSNGTLDKTFDDDGFRAIGLGTLETPVDVALQDNGTIIVGGETLDDDYGMQFVLALKKDGRIARSFGNRGVTTIENPVDLYFYDLALDSADRIITGGWSEDPTYAWVTRVRKGGGIDQSFANGGRRFMAGTDLEAVGVIRDRPLAGVRGLSQGGKGSSARVDRLLP